MPRSPTPQQIKIASVLGVDVTKDSEAVAAARIRAFVASAIGEPRSALPSSERQRKFAASLGLSVEEETRCVASAMIDDELFKRNEEALVRLQLSPGDKVIKATQIDIEGDSHTLEIEAVVSSIQPNLRVFFKGGNGQGAWPTQLTLLAKGHNSAA